MPKILNKKTIILVILSLAVLVLLIFVVLNNKKLSGDSANSVAETYPCNVLDIKLVGSLVTYIPLTDYSGYNGRQNVDETASEDIYKAIKKAELDNNIKAIVLDIDSGGGSAVAAEEIEKTLKDSTKPTIAFLRGYGDSGAYWSATGAKIIFASKLSEVGNIGVNSSYTDNSKQDTMNGLTFHHLVIGKYKDMADSNEPLNKDDEKKIMDSMQYFYDNFIQTVATNRKISEAKVKTLADGTGFNGEQALKLGLIDKLGTMDDVTAYLKNNVLGGQDADICWN